jgi:uncharacterized protein
MLQETPIIFPCQTNKLLGIVHHSAKPSRLGVLLVVGGPQYRVGSHRQFVLLARQLAINGIACFRFDYRGMGDAKGEKRLFSAVDADLQAAINVFCTEVPDLISVVLWGLCDAASASLFYAYQDARVKGLVLLNPWVFTEQGSAKTYLKYYYARRLLSADLWRKVLARQFDYRQSLLSLLGMFRQLGKVKLVGRVNQDNQFVDTNLVLPVRMRECLRRFAHPVLIILSGRDLTADEFRETIKQDSVWQALLAEPRITQYTLPEADHTFSSQLWRGQVADWTLAWLQQLAI